MKLKNFLWDFDGTLFDSYPHITAAFLKAMGEFGEFPDRGEAKAALEISYATAYERYAVTDEEKAVFRKYESDYGFEPVAKPFKGTAETLGAIVKEGGRNFLYTHRGKESSQYYLEKYDLKKYFTAFVDSSMDFPPKPAPDAADWICKTYSLVKKETVMIGDREIDVLSGINAGIFGCLFSRAKNPKTAADFIIDDVPLLLGFLSRTGPR